MVRWMFDSHGRAIVDIERGVVVAMLDRGTTADGGLIFEAVNLHEALVECCRATNALLGQLAPDDLLPIARAAYERSRAAVEALAQQRELLDHVRLSYLP